MKMLSRKLAMPLLGVLLWVLSIHAGTFATATLLPPPITGYGNDTTKEDQSRIYPKIANVKVSDSDLNFSVSFGQGVIDRLKCLETNLGWSNIHVKKGTPSYGQIIVSQPEPEALKQGRDALVASKATIYLINSVCSKYRLNRTECSKYMPSFSLASTSLKASCKQIQKTCTQEEILSQYRSIDGTCNHRTDGSRGSSFTQYKRLLFADYLDGVQEPRRAANKRPLPSARLISSALEKANRHSNKDLTLALVVWGSFIEHDLSHTATSKMVHSEDSIECCAGSGNHLSPRYIHPFCQAISVPSDDKSYSEHGLACMTYVRSIPALRTDCTFGPIEQVNQATHYLDASQIYSPTTKKALLLRTFENGQLSGTTRHNQHFLPVSQKPEEDCQLSTNDSVCFVSGDSRVNLHPQLTALHILWMREHNRIAKQLAQINRNWDDEVLYQEARRIVIAELQHITYNEWLPLILGKKHCLKMKKYNNYNDRDDASVSNSFATASVRVLISLIEGNLKLYKENREVNSSIHLRDHFNNPNIFQKPGFLDALVRGLATQPSKTSDLRFSEDLSSQLFSNGAYGFDVFSLDIQRGRDHGLPSYTSFRNICGLSKINNFNDLRDAMDPDVISSLSRIYGDVRDIDLIVGGISERPGDDSLFGPTLSCVIADQFLRTRRGDRYFYTNEDQPAPFSRAQIREIEKVTLARIFCDNADNIAKLQPHVFKTIKSTNELVGCDSNTIPRLDLKMWLDTRGKYY